MTGSPPGTVFYLDASALVKRYVAETGDSRIIALCHPPVGNTIATARVTKAEAAAALTLNGVLTQAQFPPLIFIAADDDLLKVAQSEGLGTDNPNWHP